MCTCQCSHYYTGRTVYRAVINDTTSASTTLFILDVEGTPSSYYLSTREDGFTIDTNGAVSLVQPLSVGRYELIISAVRLSNFTLYTATAVVDVLSSS